ncbi:F-box protein [Acorus calamus]|uniref:F-box protein n=1 Tax=Acorus calamus TaxID=4465 RepID=A0AAV9BYP0_ACOCL|nr:F-box protein [Acorus calamus]
MASEAYLKRYEQLGLEQLLDRSISYPSACTELSFILRGLYAKVPKPLQALLFNHTITAFRRLSCMQTSDGLSAANALLQAAEAVLPKQKKVMDVMEFKHAVVAHKRQSKSVQDGEGSTELPQDVLIRIFKSLDMCSLVSVSLVCRAWNSAASDGMLWQSQYSLLFGIHPKMKARTCKSAHEQRQAALCQKTHDEDSMGLVNVLNWKEVFRTTYTRKFTSNRGYCEHCKSVLWLSDTSCASLHHHHLNHQPKIKPITPCQVVEFLLHKSLPSSTWSSDSESDPEDDGRLPRLWAYPRNLWEDINKFDTY